ncbi:nuclear transport factor 2 family protein [Roseivirga sp. E12]|uniref:nuclear transport factor 2 family protein n=1 Tax=Roseivirga sp. E12 TaxID=2819237 RepID=UPI001ABC1409|nr:nuclear transport factor 2 family protein [Roseivirga sp. E12]MBO3697659.1 nuclear transport factor 2 family protein [Roseivirga sp. E12]
MKSISILLPLLLLTQTVSYGQHEIFQNDEKGLISNTLETHFEGWMTGDTTLLGKVLHANYQIKNVKDDKVLAFDRTTYLRSFEPGPRKENSALRIIEIDVTGNVASAKCEIETTKRLYTDYVNLMKIEEKWFIVDKTATSKLKTRDGFYINWNIDRTQKEIKPSLPISIEEAQTINCYYVKFDDQNRVTSVKYFLSGKPSNHGSFGAFELNRVYQDKIIQVRFKNTEGQSVANASGTGLIKYHLNESGHWMSKEYFDLNSKMIDADGVAQVVVTRNNKNELTSWTRYNLKKETIPYFNGIKKTNYVFDEQGQIAFTQNLDANGNLKNGPQGVAEVAYSFDENGTLLSREFRDENHQPIMHPTAKFSRVEYREFNKYGIPKRFYSMDEKGYPIRYGVLEYNRNMSIKKKTYYNKQGEIAESEEGFAYTIYIYNDQGKLIKEKLLNLAGKEI